MQTHRFKINKRTGAIEFLNPPPFKVAVDTRKRFSEIVPANIALRILFRIVRFIFGEGPRDVFAIWTRQWVCTWRLTVLQGRHKGYTQESDDRNELLTKERELWFEPKCEL